MKRLLLFLFVFAVVNLLVLFTMVKFLSDRTEARHFSNANTESNLMVIGEKKHYPLLLMGISHARNFSRHHHHERTEAILEHHFLNIGQGFGNCGMDLQKEYFQFFLDCENTADTLLLVASDILFYSTQLDANPTAFALEPFRTRFFCQQLLHCNSTRIEQLFYYLRYKFSPVWMNMQPDTSTIRTDSLSQIDPYEVEAGLKQAYHAGISQENFTHNCATFLEIVTLARSRNIMVICISPPSLFGEWPGHEQVKNFLLQQQLNGVIQYQDFSKSITEPGLYYDHHHLNTKGILFFTENYLKPLLNNH